MFQSTRPVKGATQLAGETPRHSGVSIHAPREGRDRCQPGDQADPLPVSIHAPREGRDAP